MKKNTFFKNLSLLLLCSFAMIGMQQTSNAQLTIRNYTNCTIWVYAGEAQAPCSTCNITAAQPIGPNQQLVINPSGCAPEYWKGFVYSTSPFFPAGSGYTYNPIPIGTCNGGVNSGTNCSGGTVNGTWLSAGGAGPQFAFIL